MTRAKPASCQVVGCDEPATARGLCAVHYEDLARGRPFAAELSNDDPLLEDAWTARREHAARPDALREIRETDR